MWVRDVSGVEFDDFLFGLFRHAEAVFWVHGAKQVFSNQSMPPSIQYKKAIRSVSISESKSKANSLRVSRQWVVIPIDDESCFETVFEFDQIHVDADESKFIFRRSMSMVTIVAVCLVVLSDVQTEK